ncbi:hypothetical protein O3M35_010806 [Rhynocoris fuscipes]|uniref:Solute carrier family 25 member 51 n=1 Tax=Rhynocoris fuscipes TaxID=488301 RepID=A0AAW1D0L5_9HEMI
MEECPEGEIPKRFPKGTNFLQRNREFVCGWGAASINILVTFPLNKVIFRQMLHNLTIPAAARQIRSEGIVHLYRGVLPPLLQKSVSASIMFGMYDEAKKPFADSDLPVTLVKIIAAISAGSLESILAPFERIQTLLQHERYHTDLLNMKHTVVYLYKRHGLKEFYRGVTPILLRNGPSNACFFLIREQAMSALPECSTLTVSVLQTFAIGASTGAFCSTVFYPCNVVKVHLQRKIGGPFQSVTSAVKEIYLKRGSIRGFFRGVHLNYTRACLSWGITNTAYEGLKRLL